MNVELGVYGSLSSLVMPCCAHAFFFFHVIFLPGVRETLELRGPGRVPRQSHRGASAAALIHARPGSVRCSQGQGRDDSSPV